MIQNARSRLLIRKWSSYRNKNSFSMNFDNSIQIFFFFTKRPFLGSIKWPHFVNFCSFYCFYVVTMYTQTFICTVFLCVFPQLRRIVLKLKKNAGLEIRISKHKWKRKLCLNAIMQLWNERRGESNPFMQSSYMY